MKKKTIFTFLFLIMGLGIFLTNYRPIPAALTAYEIQPDTTVIKMGELRVQFLGNTNLLFSDGETAILTDGFFTRSGLLQLLMGKIAPDSKEIKRCLNRAGIKQLAALIPLHSHFDHAMDAPVVAQLTGAKLMGSAATANIAKGCHMPDSLMVIPPLNQPVKVGNFTLTFIKSKHWQYPDAKMRALLLDCTIEKPLFTPAKMAHYKEGISYTLLIEHDTTQIAIQGSAGFEAGSLNAYKADILFLSIGGLDLMDDNYNADYQQYLTETLNPTVLIPIHWDDFSTRLSDKAKTTSLLVNLVQGFNLSKAFEQITKRNLPKNRCIKVLPLWKPIRINDLFCAPQ